MNPWDRERERPPEAAVARITAAFPDLLDGPLERIGAGWDVDVWRAGRVAFRLPRRAIAVPLLRAEAAHLGRLAPALPAPVPAPLRLAEPTPDDPWPALAVRWVPGTATETAGASVGLAAALGTFCAALHALDPGDLPDQAAKAELERRTAVAATRLDRLASLADRRAVTERLARPVPPAVRRTPCHGDLYPRHVLGAARLDGVIDWGDLGVSDPSLDLSIALTALRTPAERAAFADAYGPIAPAEAIRAERMALLYAIFLGDWGASLGDAGLLAVAQRVFAAQGLGAEPPPGAGSG